MFLVCIIGIVAFFIPVCCTSETDTIRIEKIRLKQCENVLKKYLQQTDIPTQKNMLYGSFLLSDVPKITHTLFGKITLQEIVTQEEICIKNTEIRDAIVSQLFHNPTRMIELEKLLDELADMQDLFLAYLDQNAKEHEALSNCYYGSLLAKYGLNESAWALELKQKLKKTLSIATMGLVACMPLCAQSAFNYRIAQIRTEKDLRDSSISWSTIFKNSCMLPLRSIDPRTNIYKDGYFNEKVIDKSALTRGDQALLWSEDYELPLSWGYITSYAQAVGLISSGCVHAKNSYNFLMHKDALVAKLVSEIKKIQTIVVKIYTFIEQTAPIRLDTTHNTLGSLLIMHNQLKNKPDTLIDIFKVIGDLDACYALVRNMLKLT
jgi:hypothetical protein